MSRASAHGISLELGLRGGSDIVKYETRRWTEILDDLDCQAQEIDLILQAARSYRQLFQGAMTSSLYFRTILKVMQMTDRKD